MGAHIRYGSIVHPTCVVQCEGLVSSWGRRGCGYWSVVVAATAPVAAAVAASDPVAVIRCCQVPPLLVLMVLLLLLLLLLLVRTCNPTAKFFKSNNKVKYNFTKLYKTQILHTYTKYQVRSQPVKSEYHPP